jgi:hypothetical protein
MANHIETTDKESIKKREISVEVQDSVQDVEAAIPCPHPLSGKASAN